MYFSIKVWQHVAEKLGITGLYINAELNLNLEGKHAYRYGAFCITTVSTYKTSNFMAITVPSFRNSLRYVMSLMAADYFNGEYVTESSCVPTPGIEPEPHEWEASPVARYWYATFKSIWKIGYQLLLKNWKRKFLCKENKAGVLTAGVPIYVCSKYFRTAGQVYI